MANITDLHLFNDFSPIELNEIGPLFAERVYKKGSSIIRQGEVATCLFIIEQGSVALIYKPYDGEEIRLTSLRAEDAFGWSAVLGNSYYSSSVVALEDSAVYLICGEKLDAFRSNYPNVGEKVMRKLASSVASRKLNVEKQVENLLKPGHYDKEWKGDEPMKQRVESPKNEQLQVLLTNLSAYIEQFHGGSVEFVSLDGNVLKVKMGGACLGCPLSPSTLHGWVEGTVKQFFPEIIEIIDVSAG